MSVEGTLKLSSALDARLQHLFDQTGVTQFTAPPLETILPGCDLSKHPFYDRLEADLEVWYYSRWSDQEVWHMLKELDAVLWAVNCYPHATYKRLFVAAKFMAWGFIWDDPIDDGKFLNNTESALVYHKETADFIIRCFDPNQDALALSHPNPTMDSIKEFIDEIKQDASPEVCEHILQEFLNWMAYTIESHKLRDSTDVPTLDEYLHNRVSSIGFYPYTSLIEYVNNVCIPTRFWRTASKNMEVMFFECAVGLIINNDVMSLAKELETAQYGSWVPLHMFHDGAPVQEAVNCAFQLVQDSVSKSVEAHKMLLSEPMCDHERKQLEIYFQGLQDVQLGFICLSYICHRYFKFAEKLEDESFLFKARAVAVHARVAVN